MRTTNRCGRAVLALLGGLLLSQALQAAPASMAHLHMGHVLNSWKDTPQQAGLLPVAIGEATVAAQHADFAGSKLSDLKWMKTHTLHVMHALDPSQITQGPGAGYGVLKAAVGVGQHIQFASASGDAGAAVKLHAVHVSTSADNTLARARLMLELAQQVLDTRDTAQAAKRVQQIQQLAHQLMDGEDANRDGTIGWQQGEGGLAQCRQHMGFMASAEGI